MKKKPKDLQADFLHDMVEYNLRCVCEHEDDVRIMCTNAPARVTLSIFVAPSDVGLVLGDEGKNIEALRRLVFTACKKTDLKCEIDVITNGRR